MERTGVSDSKMKLCLMSLSLRFFAGTVVATVSPQKVLVRVEARSTFAHCELSRSNTDGGLTMSQTITPFHALCHFIPANPYHRAL